MAEFITQSRTSSQAQAALSQFMNQVYGWMALGLVLSALSSFYVVNTPSLLAMIARNNILFIGLVIVQLAAVFGLGFMINRISVAAARGIFIGYTLLTGVTLSFVFLIYTSQSIMSTFMITAASFAGLSMFGYVTKRDLGPIGTFCMMGLFGMIIVMLAGIFIPALHSSTMQLTIGAIGVLVFSGLTAYDTQKIKNMYLHQQSGLSESKQAIFGALTLYLDFINLFLSLLRLMGDRR